jgi:CASPASE and TPR Repeat-Associated N-terminal domain
LATNVFVLLAVPREAGGRAYLSALWHRIGTVLGLDLPIERLGVPRDLSSAAVLGRLGGGLVAGRERRDAGVWQACVRVEHDVACVSLLMAPARQQSGRDGVLDQLSGAHAAAVAIRERAVRMRRGAVATAENLERASVLYCCPPPWPDQRRQGARRLVC